MTNQNDTHAAPPAPVEALPSVEELRKPFSKVLFAYHDAETAFSDALVNAGFGDFEEIGGDDYDNSIEFHGTENVARMNEAAQRIIFDAGFSIAFVNHKDGWETHYSWSYGKPFAASRGWRRLKREGGFDISYWPEGWTHKEWLETGYMRIVPEDSINDAALCLQSKPPVEADVGELERLEKAATPGPWCAENAGDKCNAVVIGTAFAVDDEECERPLSGWPEFYDDEGEEIATRDEFVASLDDSEAVNPVADAAFIVALRNAAPALFAELRALRAESKGDVCAECNHAVEWHEESLLGDMSFCAHAHCRCPYPQSQVRSKRASRESGKGGSEESK